jgi:CRP-like cAMP-binding protein
MSAKKATSVNYSIFPLLEESPFFKFLQPKEKKVFIDSCNSISFKRGDILCKQGLPAAQIFYIHQGIGKLMLHYQHKDLIFEIVKPNSFVGITSLVAHKYYHFSFSALTDMYVTSFDSATMNELIQKNNKMALQIIDFVNNRQVNISNRIISLTQKLLSGRVADYMLYCSQELYGSLKFRSPLSRNEMADFVAATPESVIRCLNDFQQRKIVDVAGREILILNLPMLKAIGDHSRA